MAAISSDSSQIAFLDSNTRDLWVMNSDGSQARSLYKPEKGYHLYDPMWLPGGQRILYVKFHDLGGKTEVIVESRDLNGNDPVLLLSNPDLRAMCWAQPGRLLLGIRELPPRQPDINLWDIQIDRETGKPASKLRRLTDWNGISFAAVASTADGKSLVFQNVHVQSDVYLAALTDSGSTLKQPQRFTLDERYDWPTAWSADSKTIYFYSDLGGSLDVYRQGLGQHDIEKVTSGPGEKWAPQLTSDGKWVLYMSFPTVVDRAKPVGKLMRIATSGGPSEFVTDLKGRPFEDSTQGGFPSFRCPIHGAADCVLAEEGEGDQIIFTAFDPASTRNRQVIKVDGNPDELSWDLSPDGSHIAVARFDYKSADIQVFPAKGGTPEKYSVMPWNELVAVAWSADGRFLFLSSDSSRGSSLLRYDFGKAPRLLWKTSWDLFQIAPSPDGHSLALGPQIYDANAWMIPSVPAR